MEAPLPLSQCCKAEVSKMVSKPHVESDFWPDGGITLEHAGGNGVHFGTRKELRTWCKEKGVSSGALL